MARNHHSFDWHGFKFSLIFFLILLIAGAGVHFSYNLALKYFSEIPSNPLLRAVYSKVGEGAAPERVINALSIGEVIPQEGKFIAVDLSLMKLYLYENGGLVDTLPVLSKGRPGTPWETPSGFYSIRSKEEDHFSSIGYVHMPYSMQFYGNYFIHGWPHYSDGTPVSSSFSGGCIRLSDQDAFKVFNFAKRGTDLFVYDPKPLSKRDPIILANLPRPEVGAESYLVADLDTGDVFLEKGAQEKQPIFSLANFMTTLVANEIISFEARIPVEQKDLASLENGEDVSTKENFVLGELFYPLLMQSNERVAKALAEYQGINNFVKWMNLTATSLDMKSTVFTSPDDTSAANVSTPDDLFRLAVYLSNKKSFVFKINGVKTKTIQSEEGTTYHIRNLNDSITADNNLSVLPVTIGGEKHRIAIIVLRSSDRLSDTARLAEWFTTSAEKGLGLKQTACVGCAEQAVYRKIEL